MWMLALLTLWSQWDWDLNLDSSGTYQQDVLPDQGHLSAGLRARINLEGTWGQTGSWEVAYEQTALYQKGILNWTIPNSLRWDDFDPELDQGPNHRWYHQLDRFMLEKQWNAFNLKLGRQAIGHGNGRFFNPSDIFSPLTPYALNTQYKRGVDAITLGWNRGDSLELEAIKVFNQHAPDLSVLRVGSNIRGVDLSFYGGTSWGETTWGADIAWTWKQAAMYSEWKYRNASQRQNPLWATLGIQRHFGAYFDLTIEHQYSSNGTNTFELQDLIDMRELVWGEQFFLGKNHSAISAVWETTPLLFLGMQWIHDASGSSDWAFANGSWDLSENGQLRFGAMLTRGDETSDFGRFSNAMYTELRWTF